MSKSSFVIGAAVALAVATLHAACEKGPARPTTVTPLDGSRVRQLEIAGPKAVPPGQTAQFTATAHLSNGSSQNVTNDALWQSSNPSVLSIRSGGQAGAHELGDATITADFNFVKSTTEVIVVPAGTYRLAGIVSDGESAHVPVAAARVEVIAGTGVGLATMTAGDGRYRLYGVSGQTEIRVTGDGYKPLVQSVAVADHQTENFGLTPAHPRANVSGVYTLTIAASPDCRDALPEEARVRTYTASLTQDGPILEASLTGGTFVLLRDGRGNRFRGRVDADNVTFSLTKYSHDYYKGYGQPYGDLVEQMSSSLYIVVDGTALVNPSPSRMSGALDGSFQIYSDDPRWTPRQVAECRARNHQFSLSR